MSSRPLPSTLPAAALPQKRSRTKSLILISLAVVALVVALLSLGKGTYHDYRLASAAVEQFHRQLNAADYDAIYGEASDEFRRGTTHADSNKFLETVHRKMGNSGKMTAAGFHVNWRNGRMWVDQVFNTQFALGQGQESFIWILEQDQPRLYGYHIDSPSLH